MAFVASMRTLILELARARGVEATFSWVTVGVSLHRVLVLISSYLVGCEVSNLFSS